MDLYDVKRRDVYNFDEYMDLKNPGFGGPNSAKQWMDNKGKMVNKKPKLKEYQRTVERHPSFSHPVYNSTYKAMTHDKVYQQSGKEPYTYPDPYVTGYPVVDLGNIKESFESQYVFEQHKYYPGIQLAVGLHNGHVHDHKYTLVKYLADAPIAKEKKSVQIFSDCISEEDCLDELMHVVNLYDLKNCQEVKDTDGIVRSIVCNAEDLKDGMEFQLAQKLKYDEYYSQEVEDLLHGHDDHMS